MKANAVVFSTPGLIDIRAFTTFGISAKPNSSNPIGYFGTGLKYAIAVLVRQEIPFVLYVGTIKYEFKVFPDSFRGTEFKFIWMRQLNGFRWSSWTELPFTTEFGKNWVLWQAYRELASNTKDEGGHIIPNVEFDSETHVSGKNTTAFYVFGEKIHHVHDTRDDIFLSDKLDLLELKGVKVANKVSNHIYYRGLRVLDLKEPSAYTWNLTEWQELTEDRTLKNPWMANYTIARAVATCGHEQLISRVVAMDDKFYEANLDYTMLNDPPSETFKKVTVHERNQALRYRGGSVTYASAYVPRPIVPVAELTLVQQLDHWIQSGEIAGYPDLIALLEKVKEELTEPHD